MEDDDQCDECHQWGPPLLMTPVWVHDAYGCWRSMVCPICFESLRADQYVTLELPWLMDPPSEDAAA